MNAIGFSYIFLKGNVVTEPHCPLLILPSRAIILVLAMCAHLDWQINGRDIIATRTGFADMRIRFGINLFESPALKKKIFVLTSKKLLLERV